MMELISSMGVYFWIAMLVVMIIFEAATLSLTTIWFAVGSLAAIIVSALNGSVILQLSVFALVSLLLLIMLRPLVKNVFKVKNEKTNADRIIGENALVIQKINNEDETGQVKLMGQSWSARSEDNSIIETGEKVVVCSISGVKAIVQIDNKL
ncbi:MAG: NfeD family protein [Clostridia bacterium]|nr:NfeD family protein [Clostridia bacterium]